MNETFTYDQPTSPTATPNVWLSHRGSRVESHAAAAMRQPYADPFGIIYSLTLVTGRDGSVVQDVTFDAWGTPYRFTATGTEPATKATPNGYFFAGIDDSDFSAKIGNIYRYSAQRACKYSGAGLGCGVF